MQLPRLTFTKPINLINMFWNKLFRRNTEVEFTKKNWQEYWHKPAYLQGFIISLLSDIEQLQKENDQLRKGKGRWLSPKEITKFNNLLKELELTNEN